MTTYSENDLHVIFEKFINQISNTRNNNGLRNAISNITNELDKISKNNNFTEQLTDYINETITELKKIPDKTCGTGTGRGKGARGLGAILQDCPFETKKELAEKQLETLIDELPNVNEESQKSSSSKSSQKSSSSSSSESSDEKIQNILSRFIDQVNRSRNDKELQKLISNIVTILEDYDVDNLVYKDKDEDGDNNDRNDLSIFFEDTVNRLKIPYEGNVEWPFEENKSIAKRYLQELLDEINEYEGVDEEGNKSSKSSQKSKSSSSSSDENLEDKVRNFIIRVNQTRNDTELQRLLSLIVILLNDYYTGNSGENYPYIYATMNKLKKIYGSSKIGPFNENKSDAIYHLQHLLDNLLDNEPEEEPEEDAIVESLNNIRGSKVSELKENIRDSIIALEQQANNDENNAPVIDKAVTQLNRVLTADKVGVQQRQNAVSALERAANSSSSNILFLPPSPNKRDMPLNINNPNILANLKDKFKITDNDLRKTCPNGKKPYGICGKCVVDTVGAYNNRSRALNKLIRSGKNIVCKGKKQTQRPRTQRQPTQRMTQRQPTQRMTQRQPTQRITQRPRTTQVQRPPRQTQRVRPEILERRRQNAYNQRNPVDINNEAN